MEVLHILALFSLIYLFDNWYEKRIAKKYPASEAKEITAKHYSPCPEPWLIRAHLKDRGIPYKFARVTYEGRGNGEEDRFIYVVSYWD